MALACVFSQTFDVDPVLNPNGIFLAAVDVCFAFKDDSLPITLQIRPTVNGYPDVSNILNHGQSILYPDKIPTTTASGTSLPNFNTPGTYATFTFPQLVYLTPGEYALVFQTSSVNYFIYAAVLQQPILGSSSIASSVPYVGSIFRSQNSDAWTPYQNQDLMFRVWQAQFNPSVPATVELDDIGLNYASNVNMDIFNVNGNDIILNGTSITYTYKATTSGGSLDSSSSLLPINSDIIPSTRKMITQGGNDFKAFATLTTSDPNITPILDQTRLNIVAVQNLINNCPLANSLITFTPGSGCQNVNNVVVTIDPPTQTGGVQATALAVISGNTLSNINLIQVGSGYTGWANITISGGAFTVAPTVNLATECSASGGPALARYITKTVTLAPGFTSYDILVYLSANRQSSTDVHVYYKIMSASDPDQNFLNKKWVKMNKAQNKNIYAQDGTTYTDYSFISPAAGANPPTTTTYVGSNGVTYSGFNTFAIKIVLTSSSTTIVPTCKNLRALAIA